MNLLVVDNIDSFVYNLVQYVGEQKAKPTVVLNTEKFSNVKRIIRINKITGIIISPGPKTPKDAGVSNRIILEYGDRIPILGVCLGHQCIGYVFGAKIRQAKNIMHGKTSMIKHDSTGVLRGIKNPFEATRYHSLVVDNKSLPDCLQVTATSKDDAEIMGLKHRDYPIYGLQFHPESILTVSGKKIVKNFLKIVKDAN